MSNIDWSPSAEQLAAITADAFQTDPFCHWTLGRRDTMDYVFRKEAEGVYLKSAFCAVIGNEAAMMALPPGQKLDMSMMSTAKLLAGITQRQGLTGLRRALAADRIMTQSFPQNPVAYLGTLAVRPSAQGKGLGGQLLRAFIEKAEEMGVSAWLENSNPKNHGFYSAYGFESHGNVYATANSPPLELMMRPAAETRS